MLDYLHMGFARFFERILAVHDGLHQLWAFFRKGVQQLKCIMALLRLHSTHETNLTVWLKSITPCTVQPFTIISRGFTSIFPRFPITKISPFLFIISYGLPRHSSSTKSFWRFTFASISKITSGPFPPFTA